MIYEKYLEGIKPNALARAVKIADITYNLNDTPSAKQVLKYTHALEYLNR